MSDGVLWADGHPLSWRNTIVELGYSMPPLLHEYESAGCKWCGHSPSAIEPRQKGTA